MEAESTFRVLQCALTATPLLQLLDFKHDFIVECDVSEFGLGAVLHQGGGPIAFFSRQLASRHTKLAACESRSTSFKLFSTGGRTCGGGSICDSHRSL
jgi:hypothetical protein